MAELEVLRVPFMDIQPNWDEIITSSQSGIGKIWVSCKQPGEKTLHGELVNPKGGGKQTDDRFILRGVGKRTVTVECPQAQCITTFIQPLTTLQLHDKPLLCMDVSGSGALGACSGENGALWVWDADTGERRRTLKGHVGDVYTCRYFPSGIVVVSGGADLRLKIWSAQDGSCPRTLTGHTRGITDTVIIEKGRNIVSVSNDGTARLWDCGSGKCLAIVATLGCPINACALRHSAVIADKDTEPPTEPESGTGGKLLLLACEDGTFSAWDVRSRERVFSYEGRKSPVTRCAFVTETTAVFGCEDGLITSVDLRNPGHPAMQTVSFGVSAITSLLPLGEDQCLATCRDGSCTVWSPSDPASRLWRLTGPELDGVTATQAIGGKIYTSSRDGRVRVYSQGDVS